MVSVLQHKDGSHAAAPLPGKASQEEDDHPLGDVPHQVRGYLRTFSNTVVTGKSYDCCSACSDRVTDAYSKDGWEFVKKVLNEKGYVEEISGLAEVSHTQTREISLNRHRCNELLRRRSPILNGMSTTRKKTTAKLSFCEIPSDVHRLNPYRSARTSALQLSSTMQIQRLCIGLGLGTRHQAYQSVSVSILIRGIKEMRAVSTSLIYAIPGLEE